MVLWLLGLLAYMVRALPQLATGLEKMESIVSSPEVDTIIRACFCLPHRHDCDRSLGDEL